MYFLTMSFEAVFNDLASARNGWYNERLCSKALQGVCLVFLAITLFNTLFHYIFRLTHIYNTTVP